MSGYGSWPGGGGPRQGVDQGGARAPHGGGAPRPNHGASDRGRIEELLRPPKEKLRYFSENDPRAINAKLLGDEAEEVAKKLAEVPAGQLRRFYAEVMALKRRAELAGASGPSDEEIQAEMQLLRAKAAYTWGRKKDSKNDAYPEELVSFFTRHAASVETRHDFLRGFQPHFEAVMAFHKVFEKKKERDGA